MNFNSLSFENRNSNAILIDFKNQNSNLNQTKDVGMKFKFTSKGSNCTYAASKILFAVRLSEQMQKKIHTSSLLQRNKRGKTRVHDKHFSNILISEIVDNA